MIQTLHIVPEYNEELIYPAICKSMEALHIAADLRPEMKIVIKPNLVMAKSPDFPATTHPLVVKAVIRWLRKQGMQHITIAESSGGLYNAEAMRHVYHVCGMDTLGEGAELNMDFSAQTVNCPAGFKNHSFHLITPIVEADYIINICKLKTHAMTGYSGGIKNLFGTIPGLEKPQMHYRWPEIEDFSNMLLELAQTVTPQLTVIDAIDAMLAAFQNGNDIVYGVRAGRKQDSAFKRATAQGYYRLLRALGADVVYNHADYRLMSRRALDALAEYKEVNLFLRGLVPLVGYPSTVVYYERGRRFAGKSKYPLRKMLSFAWEGVSSLTVSPLRLITRIGIVMFLVSIAMLIYFLVRYFTGHTVAGWSSLAVSIWAIGGLQLLAIGVVGEYIGKIYLETKARPRYRIETELDDREAEL